MPNEITSSDTVRALFVSAFPQQLTMKMLESPSVAVYIKDDMRNVYYELTDVRWVVWVWSCPWMCLFVFVEADPFGCVSPPSSQVVIATLLPSFSPFLCYFLSKPSLHRK